MGDWNKVVLDDLTAMVGQYRQGASDYRAAVDSVKADPADSGDGDLNEYLKLTMDAIAKLAEKAAALIEEHGEKVAHACDEYGYQDDFLGHALDNRELYDDMEIKK